MSMELETHAGERSRRFVAEQTLPRKGDRGARTRTDGTTDAASSTSTSTASTTTIPACTVVRGGGRRLRSIVSSSVYPHQVQIFIFRIVYFCQSWLHITSYIPSFTSHIRSLIYYGLQAPALSISHFIIFPALAFFVVASHWHVSNSFEL